MFRKENLILSYAGGMDFCNSVGFQAFVQSLRNVPNADLALITHAMPQDVRADLCKKGVEIIDIDTVEYILRDRHLGFWNYLNEHGHKYQHVLISDCKDVIFQKNPFEWIDIWKSRFDNISGNKDFLNHFVILVSEGFKMSRSGFACIEHFEFERDVPLKFAQPDRNRWVVNGGIMLGTPRCLQDFVFLIWSVTLKSSGNITDQATLNWLLRFLGKDATYSVSYPQHDDLCIVCEGVKEEGVPLVLKDGLVLNPLGEPYFIVHQWDRLEDLQKVILSQYRS